MKEINKIFVLIILIICFLLIRVLKNKNNRLSGFFSFQLIEDEYLKWYHNNSNTLNDSNVSMYDIDSLIYKLKEILARRGITNSLVQEYVQYLELTASPPQKLLTKLVPTIFSFFVSSGLFSFFVLKIPAKESTDTTLKMTLSSWLKYINPPTIEEILSTNFISKISIIVYILIYMLIYILILYLYHFLLSGNNLFKNSRRLFVLKRLTEIWNYNVIRLNTANWSQHNMLNNENYVLSDLKGKPDKLDLIISDCIGEDYMRENISIVFALFNIISPRIKKGLNLLKRLCGSVCIIILLCTISVVSVLFPINLLSFVSSSFIGQILLLIINLIVQIFLLLVYSVIFLSQIDKLSGKELPKANKESEKKYVYRLKARQCKDITPIIFTLPLIIVEQLLFEFFKFANFDKKYILFFPVKLLILIALFEFIIVNTIGLIIELKRKKKENK